MVEAKESLDVQSCSGQLPDTESPKLRPALQHLSEEAKLLAQRLLQCLAIDLKIDPQTFLNAHSGMLTGTRRVLVSGAQMSGSAVGFC